MPLLTKDEISNAVESGDITAISLDTSVFDRYKFRLESGQLKSLEQFNRTKIHFLLSDLVVHEMVRHLEKEACGAQSQVASAMKSIGSGWGVSEVERTKVLEDLLGKLSPEERTKQRLDAYFKSTGATVLQAEKLVKLADVVRMYTTTEAPFGDRERKKNEFPDALALLTLEQWANDKATLVLAVSTDSDWRNYCEKSERVCFLDDLPSALSTFQRDASVFERTVGSRLLKNEFRDQITECLEDQLWKLEFSVEASSNYSYEDEHIDTTLIDWTPSEDGDLPELHLLETNGDSVIVELAIDCQFQVEFSFSFTHWDGIDREYLPIGSVSTTQDEQATLRLLLTFVIEDDETVLDYCELVPERLHLDFGEVEPDWMSGKADDFE